MALRQRELRARRAAGQRPARGAQGLALRGNLEDALALADLLLLRGTAEAAREALAALAAPDAEIGLDSSPGASALRLRLACAMALAGDSASACARLLEHPGDLLSPRAASHTRDRWTARFAPLLLARGRGKEAAPLLLALATQSRAADTALVRMARESAADRMSAPAFAAFLAGAIARNDSLIAASLGALRPRPVSVRAEDGFPLRTWLVPARPGAPLALVVLDPEALTLATADSLVAQLHRAGIAVALLDPRGSRGSAAAACPLPSRWTGREDAFQQRLARDVSLAIAPCARALGATPARVCVLADGPLALAAAAAARLDPRVRAVVLAGAVIPGSARGRLVAALRGARAATYVQQGPEDVYGNEVTDHLARLLDPRRVRVADSEGAGRGVALFRTGPAPGRRLTGWLDDLWSSPRATPPSGPRTR